MKPAKPILRPWLPALSAGIAFCSTLTVQATEYTWDSSATAGIQTGAGNWATTATNWTTDGGATRVVWPNTGTDDDARLTGATTLNINSSEILLDDFTTTYGSGFGYLQQLNSGSRTLTLTGGNYDGTGTTGSQFNIASGGGLSFAGTAGTTQIFLAGSSDLVKLGGGNLFFGAGSINNTLTGNIHINEGFIYVNSANDTSLGNAANDIYIDSGALSTQATSGTLTLNSGRTIQLGASGGRIGGTTTMVVQGQVTGTGSLEKIGSGILTLETASNYAGTTTITAGTLRLEANGTMPASSDLAINGSGIFNIRNTDNWSYNGTITGDGTGSVNPNSGTNATLAGDISGVASINVSTTGTHAAISGDISGGTSVNVSNSGSSLRLSGNNSYNGATTVSGGTLIVEGSGDINDSALTINSGRLRYNSSVAYSGTLTFTSGTVGGTNMNGSLSGLTIGTGQTLSPGNSPGTATTASQTWAVGGTYEWELNSAAGTPGTDPGWDLVNGTGTLDITAALGSEFNISVTSLTLGNLAGAVSDFNQSLGYNWLIADFDTITGFSADAFLVDTSAFSNAFTGTFGVALGNSGSIGGDDTQIYLTYTAIPEPSAALLGGIGLLALYRRRR